MPQPCADDRTDDDVEECLVEPGFGCVFRLKHAPHDVQTDQKAQREKQAVPAECQRADGNNFGRNIPGDICEKWVHAAKLSEGKSFDAEV